MGRTSKFTFPVPGKRQKHQSTIGPIVSNPMSKAQRILGAAELNIDAPKQWDEASNSGISVSVSDHTSNYTATERGYRRTDEPSDDGHGGYNGFRGVKNANRWEMESETVPAHVQSGRGMRGEDTARDYMSDASSVRRRQSNSTLKSWYDKSKMPLSISQQTSSSAMAKGLPAKAHALLDVDGNDTASNASHATKLAKRPSRLNLSHLLHGGRHREQHLHPSPSSGSLRSQEFSRSPSIASSFSPDTGVTSPVQPRTPRKLLKKPTKERLAEAAAEQASIPRRGSASTQGDGLNSPRDLYDHYERTAFRDILESPAEEAGDPFDEEEFATKMLISDFPAAPVGPTPLRSPSYPRSSTASSNPVINEPRLGKDDARRGSEASGNAGYPMHPAGHYHPTPDNDYASSLASVSSRHTKTSKASKRTNPSITESDRQERSVLSLSSDSEEDDETGKSATSISSFSRGPMDAPPSPASVSRKSVGSRGESISDTASRKSGKRASFAATHTYLTVPAGSSPNNLKPTTINPRTSSVNRGGPLNSHPPQPPAAPRSAARMSTMSTTSNASADWQKAYSVHEAKAVAVHSVASTASSLQGVAEAHQAPEGNQQRQSLRSGDQPTPPLSPSSVEFCLQPDMSFDVAESSRNNPRFMAVTRQEQMLLAALRNKRAMMRENIIAEFEGELSSPQSEAPTRGFHKHTSSQATIRGPQSEDHRPQQHLRHQLSSTSTSTITSSSRSAEKRREGSPATKHSSTSHRVRSGSRGTRSNAGDYSSPASSRSPYAKETRSQTSLSNSRNKTDREERHLHSHRQHTSRAQAHHGSELNPDLDAPSFDDIPSEDEEQSPVDENLYQNHHYAPRSSQQIKGGLSPSEAGSLRNARSRSSSSKASVRWRPAQEGKLPSRVPEEEDGLETPRPDSPMASTQMLAPPGAGMDRKKAVRLSAVGRAGPEVGWWGDDG